MQKFAIVNQEGNYIHKNWFQSSFDPPHPTPNVHEAFLFNHIDNAIKFARVYKGQWDVQPITVL